VVRVTQRFWPLAAGRIITSPYGPRDGGYHYGTDFGFPGGSAGKPVFAIDSGIVVYSGAAQGYGGPDPAGWIVIKSDSGVWEYGHIVREPHIRPGVMVDAGTKIATINPNSATNGGTAPHLHLSWMPGRYDPNQKKDPIPVLRDAAEPGPIKEKNVGWSGDPVWLADVLKNWKKGSRLKTVEMPDWNQYGHGDFGQIWGVMVHHTGNANADAMSIRNGRPDLAGPLSNLHIAQDGTVTVVAAGVCWHAGYGSYPGIPTNGGNQVLIGIECAWPRDTSITPATQTRERWPDPQIIAMRDTVAAILDRLGYGPDRVIAHKEYAGRSQGKWDPGNLDMNWFRSEVGLAQRGQFIPKPTPVPTPPDTSKVYPRDYTDRELLEDIWKTLQPLKGKS
jgi:hypothetical protein